MVIFFTILLFLFVPATGHTDYFTGISTDTSSNMLLRPDGPSGTLTSFYGGMQQNVSRGLFSYNVDAGLLQHYEGIQYHRHNVDLGFPVVSSPKGFLAVALEGTLARYGEVTVLNGYEQFGIASTAKYYLPRQFLLRWEGGISNRSYRDFPTENYREYESFFRVDRFFGMGLTLRAQVDLGMRSYTDYADTPSTSLAGFRFRAAKSLGTQWGIWAEAYTSDILNADAPSDTTSIYDRIFLDDPYKYAKSGLVVNVKHLLSSQGMVQLRTSMLTRTYDGSLNSAFWYLPPEGWDEREISVYLTVTYLPSWMSGLVSASIDLYYIDVEASEDFLSYRSGGLAIRFEH